MCEKLSNKPTDWLVMWNMFFHIAIVAGHWWLNNELRFVGDMPSRKRCWEARWNKQLASHFGIRGAFIICRAMLAIFSAGQYSNSLTFADSHQLWTLIIKVSYYLSAIYSVHLRNTYFKGKTLVAWRFVLKFNFFTKHISKCLMIFDKLYIIVNC